jgi:hypothetical protein
MPGIQRLGFHEQLVERSGRASADAVWSALFSAVLVVVPILLAIWVHSAFLFASLGPIVYEIVERPLAPASSPRNMIVGNALALLVGYAALAVFGLRSEPSVVNEGVTVARAFAVICAVGVLGALLGLANMMHPPAGSTLLLITLGIIREPVALVAIFGGVVVTTLLGFVLNRAAGIDVPPWSPRPEQS